MKKFLPYFAGIVMAVIFGFSFLFSKNALDSLSTFELLFLRFSAAALGMTALVIVGIIKINLGKKKIVPLLVVGIWQPIIYFIMETMGLKYTSSSEAGVMMAFIPVLVAIFAAFLLDEKPSRLQLVFIVISVAGVIAIVLGGGSSAGSGHIEGIIYLLGAVFSAAMFNIFSRKASRDFTPYEITYFMMIIGAVIFGGVYLIQGIIQGNLNMLSRVTQGALTSILYLGILSSIVAFLLVNYSLSKLPASQSAVFANLTTVVSVIAGITFRNEAFELYKVFGAVLIVAGVWGTNYFGLKKTEGESSVY